MVSKQMPLFQLQKILVSKIEQYYEAKDKDKNSYHIFHRNKLLTLHPEARVL